RSGLGRSVVACPECGRPVRRRPGSGRQRVYCDPACRMAAWRARHGRVARRRDTGVSVCPSPFRSAAAVMAAARLVDQIRRLAAGGQLRGTAVVEQLRELVEDLDP
ncbi:MAG: hypothetical protein L0Y54_16210, partial [Sporichthyaceae bacterium]|nr:hypothetical protein [Sporichthyaceae bacterium]